ncbi:MAG TPA: class F sortase [Micromonospora sp.]|nr:class F sortase [Micromonospora sp.]
MRRSRFDPYRLPPRARSWPGWTAPLAVVLVLLGVFVTGAGIGRIPGLDWPDRLVSNKSTPSRDFPVLEPSRPVRLEVPTIGVRASVHRVGLADDGSIAVPALDRHNETGWYDGGPTPGQAGPAIIVGHSDTRTGPSVFHDLRRLRAGDRVRVTRMDRSVAVFEVNSVEYFDKDNLPPERVYGDFTRPGLRLITCGGEWVGGSIGYSDNVIAFATLVDAEQP